MTTTATPGRTLRDRIPTPPPWPAGLPKVRLVAETQTPDWRTTVVSSALMLMSAVLLALIVNLMVVSQLQHWTAQHRLYGQLRLSLSEGSVPIGPLGVDGKPVPPGTPIALLTIPKLGVKEVVVAGTTSEQTKLGVGHRRDTPYPGQAGASVLMGRASAYGGVFSHLSSLAKGDTFTVRTGQGLTTYSVDGPRIGTVSLPALDGQHGRLTLITASGGPFQPHRVLRVDAEQTSKILDGPGTAIGQVAPSEQAMAGDPDRLFSLSWLAELLVLAAVAAVWSWQRWNRLATWLVFVPLLMALALSCADRVTDLLPNLL